MLQISVYADYTTTKQGISPQNLENQPIRGRIGFGTQLQTFQ